MLSAEATAATASWFQDGLHDLCQPLTALQCRLFLTTLGGESTKGELRQAIQESLVQCERMLTQMRQMQARLTDGEEKA